VLQVHEGYASAKKFFTPHNAPSYDSVVSVTTFGMDARWKGHIVDAVGGRTRVLDMACGTGILSSLLAKEGRQVAGIDLAFEYLGVASKKMPSLFVQGTAEVLPYRDGAFDAVVSSYLAKYVDAKLVVQECWRVLAPGGLAVFHDFTCPAGAMRSLWASYFAILRLAGHFMRSWKPVFDDLDRVICESGWERKVIDAMEEQGFRGIAHRRYTAGTAAIVRGRKP
jgi:demethylmenaquinone methyltransferase/2-methoxy-6-polyprenyl-1,4-benzoquinol methylase